MRTRLIISISLLLISITDSVVSEFGLRDLLGNNDMEDDLDDDEELNDYDEPNCPSDPFELEPSPCQYMPFRGGNFMKRSRLRYNSHCQPTYDHRYEGCDPQGPYARPYSCSAAPPMTLSRGPCQYDHRRRGYYQQVRKQVTDVQCNKRYVLSEEPCNPHAVPPNTPSATCVPSTILEETRPCGYVEMKKGYFITKRYMSYDHQCLVRHFDDYEPCQTQIGGSIQLKTCLKTQFRIPQPVFQSGRRLITEITMESNCSASLYTNWQACGNCCGRDAFFYVGCSNGNEDGYAVISWDALDSNAQCSRDRSLIPCRLYAQADYSECRNRSDRVPENISPRSSGCVNGFSFNTRTYHLPNYNFTINTACVDYFAVVDKPAYCS